MSDTPHIDTELFTEMEEAGVVLRLPDLAELPDEMAGQLIKAEDLHALGGRVGQTPDEQAAIDLALEESTVVSASNR